MAFKLAGAITNVSCTHWTDLLRKGEGDPNMKLGTRCLDCYFNQSFTDKKYPGKCKSIGRKGWKEPVMDDEFKKIVRALIKFVLSTVRKGVINCRLSIRNIYYNQSYNTVYVPQEKNGQQVSEIVEVKKIGDFIKSEFDSPIPANVQDLIDILSKEDDWIKYKHFFHPALWTTGYFVNTMMSISEVYVSYSRGQNTEEIRFSQEMENRAVLASNNAQVAYPFTDNFMTYLQNKNAPDYFQKSLEEQRDQSARQGEKKSVNGYYAFETRPMGLIRFLRNLCFHGGDIKILGDPFVEEEVVTAINSYFGKYICELGKGLFELDINELDRGKPMPFPQFVDWERDEEFLRNKIPWYIKPS